MVAVSYYRFMVIYDYTVSYDEGDCDPYTESCFVYCEDEECSEPFYYTSIYRDASTLVALCGDDITDCDEAYYCQEDEVSCEIVYCDSSTGLDECEMLTEADEPFDDYQDSGIEQNGNEDISS